MGSHPANLVLRFILEMIALVTLGVWGWQKGDGWLRFVLALGIPLIAALLWGVFRVPNDPGPAPVAIPGILRLVLELSYFALAVWALYDLGVIQLSWILGVVVVVHYAFSYDRVFRLIKT